MNDYHTAEELRIKLDLSVPTLARLRTKDRFHKAKVRNNMEHYAEDQKWLGLANPDFLKMHQEKEAWDREVLVRMLKMNLKRSEERLKTLSSERNIS